MPKYFCITCGKKIKGRFRSLLCEQCKIREYYQCKKNGKENSEKNSEETIKKEEEIK